MCDVKTCYVCGVSVCCVWCEGVLCDVRVYCVM